MICSYQNKQFIEKILGMGESSIKKMLKEEDENYIVQKQRQIIRNMPEDLKPNQNIQTKATTFLKNIMQVNYKNEKLAAQKKLSQFPSTFNQKTKSNHWNTNSKSSDNKLGLSGSKGLMKNSMSNFEGFRSGLEGEANLWKGQRLPDVHVELNERERESITEELNGLNLQLGIKSMQQEKEIEKEIQRKSSQSGREGDNQAQVTFTHLLPQQNILTNPFAPPLHQQKHSPFISNKSNFLDLHTNKKPLNPTYITPETYSMNMLQYAHNQKRENTFQDSYSYPNVIMSGSGTGWMKTAQGLRENPFRGTFVAGPRYETYEEGNLNGQSSIAVNEERMNLKVESESKFRQNVQDVLKYTLGDKRYTNSIIERQGQLARSINLKSNVMESSFQKQLPTKKQRVLENPFVRRPSSNYKY